MILLKERLLLLELCASEYSRRAVRESVRRNASAPWAGAEKYLAYLISPVVAKSGSHNLDAPLPGAPKMSGEIGLLEHLWGRSPFSVRQGAEAARRADRGDTHTQTILPSFGPHGCVKPYCYLSDCIGFLLESTRCYSKLEAGRGWMSTGFLYPLYVRMGLLL